MEQTATLPLGGSQAAIDLPDGSPIGAVRVDNPSGWWYQVYPGGGVVAPYSQGSVLTFDQPTPSVGVVTIPTLDGIASVNAGIGPTITVYSPDASPAYANPTNVQQVNVANTPSVNVSGTASVNIANTPAVTLTGAANNVNVANTPAVNIANTPAVTLMGAANNVNVANTPNVNVTGTPNVNVANTPTVNVNAGTIDATITAGTVSVQNVANGILTQAGTLRSLGYQGGGTYPGTTTSYTLTLLDRALVIQVGDADGITPWHVIVYPQGGSIADAIFDNDNIAPLTTIVVFVNTAKQLGWTVQIAGPTGTSYRCLVSADSALPVMDIARLGQRDNNASVPVSVAFDSAPVAQIVDYNPKLWTPNAYGPQETFYADSGGSILLPSATAKAWLYIAAQSALTTYLRMKRIRIEQLTAATGSGGYLMLGLYFMSAGSSQAGGSAITNKQPAVFGDAASTSTAAYVSNSTFTTEPSRGGRIGLWSLQVGVNYPLPAGIDHTFGGTPGTEQPKSPYGYVLFLNSQGGFTGSPSFLINVEWSEAGV